MMLGAHKRLITVLGIGGVFLLGTTLVLVNIIDEPSAENISKDIIVSPTYNTDTTTSIEEYCKIINEGLSPQALDDVSTYTDGNGAKWERVAENSPIGKVYQGAKVWLREKNIVYVSMYKTSPSGDWTQFSEYCYRANGTLAKVFGTLNTFYSSEEGGVRVFTDRYFDADGALIASSTEVLNMHTEMPTIATYQDRDTPIYKTSQQLPFFHLIDR